MVKYITVDEYRVFTNLQDSEYSDAQLTTIIGSVESWFDDQIKGHTLYNYGIITEDVDGNGNDYIFTKRWPLQSFTSLAIDNNDDGSRTTLDSNNYNVCTDTGKVVINGDADIPLFYTPGNKKENVRMVYIAGVASVPEYLKLIIVQAVTNVLNKLDISDGIKDQIAALVDNGMRMSLL